MLAYPLRTSTFARWSADHAGALARGRAPRHYPARACMALLLSVLLCAPGAEIEAQAGSPSSANGGDRVRFRSQSWCADSATACWTGGASRQWFNGVRIVADLDLGLLFQGGGNKFENGVKALPKLALEFNIHGGWAAAQVAVLGPSNTTFDESSATGVAYLQPAFRTTRSVPTSWGWLAGVSVLDGSLMAGVGRLFYDKRAFRRSVEDTTLTRLGLTAQIPFNTLTRDSFGYASLQPISSIRASFKRAKEDTDRP